MTSCLWWDELLSKIKSSLSPYRSKWWHQDSSTINSCYLMHPHFLWISMETMAACAKWLEELGKLLPVTLVCFDSPFHSWFWQQMLVFHQLAMADGSCYCVPLLVQYHTHSQISTLHCCPDQHFPQHMQHISETGFPTHNTGVCLWYTILYGLCPQICFFWCELLNNVTTCHSSKLCIIIECIRGMTPFMSFMKLMDINGSWPPCPSCVKAINNNGRRPHFTLHLSPPPSINILATVATPFSISPWYMNESGSMYSFV